MRDCKKDAAASLSQESEVVTVEVSNPTLSQTGSPLALTDYSNHSRKAVRHKHYEHSVHSSSNSRGAKRSNSPTLSPASQSIGSSNDEVTSTINLNSSLASLSYSTAAGTGTGGGFSSNFPSSANSRSLCFVCLDHAADSTLPVNKDLVRESFPNFSKDVSYHKGVCSKCYRKITELETLQSFKQFCDLMFEEAKSELEQLFDLSRHTRLLIDLEQQEQFRKCLTNAPETNLIGSLQVDDDQLPPSSLLSRQHRALTTNRSSNTLDSDNNTGSSPISSAGGSSSSKKNSGVSLANHNDHSVSVSTGPQSKPNPPWANGGGQQTQSPTSAPGSRRKAQHKSHHHPGSNLRYEDEEAGYFGSQSSGGGGPGATDNDSGSAKRSIANNESDEPERTTTDDRMSSVGFLEGLALRGLNSLSSSFSVSGHASKIPPFQNLSSSFELNSSQNGSRVNLNLQLAETLIKDAIRTASFDAGFSDVDFSTVSVDLCVDSSNTSKPVQLNLTCKQPSSCDTTPVRSFAETNGDITEREQVEGTGNSKFNQKASRKSESIESNSRFRSTNIQSSHLNNPLHIDADDIMRSSLSKNIQLPRNSSEDSLVTSASNSMASPSFPRSTTSPAQSQHNSLAPANRSRFYQFKTKDKEQPPSDDSPSRIDKKPTPSAPGTGSTSGGSGGAASSNVQVPSKLSSGIAMTTSTSSTSISKLRMPNIKSSHHYLAADEQDGGASEPPET